MDFSKTNIQDILFSGIKNRFSDFSPYDFEDFIAQLFKDNGYDVEGTNYSGDYGADVITSKNGIKTAIQVKRYSKTNKRCNERIKKGPQGPLLKLLFNLF